MSDEVKYGVYLHQQSLMFHTRYITSIPFQNIFLQNSFLCKTFILPVTNIYQINYMSLMHDPARSQKVAIFLLTKTTPFDRLSLTITSNSVCKDFVFQHFHFFI